MNGIAAAIHAFAEHPEDLSVEDAKKAVEIALRHAERFEQLFGAQARESGERRRRNRDLDNNLAAEFMESVLDLREHRRLLEAVQTGLACARLHPLDPHYLKALVYSLLPWSVVKTVRDRRKRSSSGKSGGTLGMGGAD